MSLSIANSPTYRRWLNGAIVIAAVGSLFLFYPFGAWLVLNLGVPTAALAATLTYGRELPRLAFRFCLLAALGWLGISVGTEYFHRSRLPPDVGVRGIVAMGWQSGLSGWCGAVVFRLDQRTLDEARGGAVGGAPLQEGWPTATGWLPTPLPNEIVSGATPDARSWAGLDCSLSPIWAWSMRHAASTRGSLYRVDRGRVVLLSPALGVVAVAFNS